MATKTKSAKKTTTRPSKASKAPRSAAKGAEPEVLNERTVAADQAPVRTKPAKMNKALDQLDAYLRAQSEPRIPVRVAVEAVYGGACTPDREHETLLLLKEDDRFEITKGNGVNAVGLAGSAGAAAAKPEASPAKTLGDHVEDAKGRPQRITWDADVGSSVLLLTDGQPPRKALIRNIHNHGAYALYDLTIEAGGTIDGLPAHRVGRDLDAEGEMERMRTRIRALERHADRSADLAQKHIAMAAVERTMAEALSKHRKSMEEVAHKLAEHARSEPGQTDLRDVVGEGAPTAPPTSGPSRGAKLKAPPTAAEDKLAEAPKAAAKAPNELELDTDVRLDDLMASRLEQATASTGKPQQVKPIVLVDEKRGINGSFLAVDSQAGRAVLLPVFSKAEWKARMAAEFGKPLAIPSDTQTDQLAKGGKLCGLPVKVGRATCWLGADKHALLVRLPKAEAEPEKLTGKDAAAGR